MERNVLYFIKNKKTNEVWSGYKWKKGTWQKAMLYKRMDTVTKNVVELAGQGYDCNVMMMTVAIEEY